MIRDYSIPIIIGAIGTSRGLQNHQNDLPDYHNG